MSWVHDSVHIEHRGSKVFEGEEFGAEETWVNYHNIHHIVFMFEGRSRRWFGVEVGVSGWELFGLMNRSKKIITDKDVSILSLVAVARVGSNVGRDILHVPGSNNAFRENGRIWAAHNLLRAFDGSHRTIEESAWEEEEEVLGVVEERRVPRR